MGTDKLTQCYYSRRTSTLRVKIRQSYQPRWAIAQVDYREHKISIKCGDHRIYLGLVNDASLLIVISYEQTIKENILSTSARNEILAKITSRGDAPTKKADNPSTTRTLPSPLFQRLFPFCMFVYFSCFEANEMRVESNRFAYYISHAEASIIFACAQKFLPYFRGNAFFC